MSALTFLSYIPVATSISGIGNPTVELIPDTASTDHSSLSISVLVANSFEVLAPFIESLRSE